MNNELLQIGNQSRLQVEKLNSNVYIYRLKIEEVLKESNFKIIYLDQQEEIH